MAERKRKTARQRAEEALGVVDRRIETLTAKRDKAKATYEAAKRELSDAEKRREYLILDPALPSSVREQDVTAQAGEAAEAGDDT